MALHQDTNGNIHDDMSGAALHLLPDGCVQITQAEADTLRAPTPAQLAAEKAAVLTQTRAIRETVLNRLAGIQLNTIDAPTISAIQVARASLLNITSIAGVMAATDGTSTKTAIMAEWKIIAARLATSAPSAASVFSGLGM